jgi:hypothetical protein
LTIIKILSNVLCVQRFLLVGKINPALTSRFSGKR